MGFGDLSKQESLLVVEDDLVAAELLRKMLEQENFAPVLVDSAERALELLKEKTFFGVISDVHFVGGIDGFELLKQFKKNQPDAFVVLITSKGSLQGAVSAVQFGAFDYLCKPFAPEELMRLLRRAYQEREARKLALRFQAEKKYFSEEATGISSNQPLAKSLQGKSPKMISVYKALAKASLSGSNVLIIGESGTGKELVARAIHCHSDRSAKGFVTVNCGALTETLLESELFGHVKGSFTGAFANKKGLFEEADGGTIFLDEIGDVSPAMQVKLLRVLQEGEFKPVGSAESRVVSTRVIAATHRNLERMVKEGKFREDLFYRLKVITLQLPPLRERLEDIPELANCFLERQVSKQGRKDLALSREAMALLQNYSWPGNIRELEHAIERACAMTNTSVLFPEDFPPEILRCDFWASGEQGAVAQDSQTSCPQEMRSYETMKSLEAMEKKHIVRILQEVNFNKSRAADVLGIDRATLYRKAARYGIRLLEEKMI